MVFHLKKPSAMGQTDDEDAQFEEQPHGQRHDEQGEDILRGRDDGGQYSCAVLFRRSRNRPMDGLSVPS